MSEEKTVYDNRPEVGWTKKRSRSKKESSVNRKPTRRSTRLLALAKKEEEERDRALKEDKDDQEFFDSLLEEDDAAPKGRISKTILSGTLFSCCLNLFLETNMYIESESKSSLEGQEPADRSGTQGYFECFLPGFLEHCSFNPLLSFRGRSRASTRLSRGCSRTNIDTAS